MQIRIALAGEPAGAEAALKSAEALLGRIGDRFAEIAEGPLFLESPLYTGESWHDIEMIRNSPSNGFCNSSSRINKGGFRSVTEFETKLRSVVGDAICDRADLLLMIWNEDTSELNGASWELIQSAYRRKLPCIWISSVSNRIYWIGSSYYEAFDDAKLDLLAESMPTECAEPVEDDGSRLFMGSFWRRARAHYMKKHDAARNVYDAENDAVMTDGFKAESECDAHARKTLLNAFKEYNKAAIALNSKYQTVLYMRSVMPLIASVFISIGFYAETLFGIFGIPSYILSIAAGTGFLLHGLVNLYIYILSKDSSIKKLHEAFLNNRFIAEMLRVMIHFIPYGISMDLRNLCGSSREAYAAIRQTADKAGDTSRTVNHSVADIVLRHLKEMLTDQREYHISSKKRYENIVRSLDKWSKVFFAIGFTVVLLRAALQFVLSLPPVSNSFNLPFLGSNPAGYIKSFANMAALMLPAAASYFSAKAAQCNFRYNMENHSQMAKRIDSFYRKADVISKTESIQMDILNTLGNETAELMLINDTAAWRTRFMNVTVTHM